MATIVLHADSLTPNITKADIVMGIKETEDVSKKIKDLARLIQDKLITVAPGWMHVLHIFCNSSDNGLELGKGIDHKNVTAIFLPLKCKVGSIVIHGCGAAAVYSKANNGALMCKRMAQSVFANVTASDVVPSTSTVNHIFNGCNKNLYLNHGGTVGEWNQAGKLIFVQEYNEAGNLIPDNTHLNYHYKSNFKKPSAADLTNPKNSSTSFFKKNLMRITRAKRLSALYQHFSHFFHGAIIN